MRTISDEASVRLYRLDAEGGAETILYGPLGVARRAAAARPEAEWDMLYVQTDSDVIAWLDLEEG